MPLDWAEEIARKFPGDTVLEEAARDLGRAIGRTCGQSEERYRALVRLEEAVMWAQRAPRKLEQEDTHG